MQNNYFEMFYKTKEFMRDLANERFAESEKEATEEKENILEDITEPTDEELKELESEDEKDN
jgi:hypothetical protein